MEESSIDLRIAHRLRKLRAERSWSLDELANRTGISRATLSRMENAEVSPTATVLGKLAAVYELTVSRLMHMVEGDFAPLVRREAQPVWTDASIGFCRRSVSPPAQTLSAEVLECELQPRTRITYDEPPRQGLEHHLLLTEGELQITIDGHAYDLRPGDCLRYQLFGSSAFQTSDGSGARYILVVV
jgi:transcriptional regulator with XRE-family HTH domain